MTLDPKRVAASAGRPVGALTRRDVARALLTVPAAEALQALPDLRRQLVAAGNPLSAAFWESAESVLRRIDVGGATVGDVREWLEATGTEPTSMIGLFGWEVESERSPLQDEMHGRLVEFLEEGLAAGQIDPDRLATGDAAAREAHVDLQERWLTSPLPDGRVPMHAVMDEIDDELLAAWDEVDAAALAELRRILDEVGERPLPREELTAACPRIREALSAPGLPGDRLASCGGIDRHKPPTDDVELWLTLATGVVNPMGEPSDDDIGVLAALATGDHADWLGAIGGLARGGPGTPASPGDLVQLIVESDDVAGEYQDDEDEEAAEVMFGHVVELWRVLGAVDERERLTALGWWGIPEALQRAWEPQDE